MIIMIYNGFKKTQYDFVDVLYKCFSLSHTLSLPLFLPLFLSLSISQLLHSLLLWSSSCLSIDPICFLNLQKSKQQSFYINRRRTKTNKTLI